MFFFQMPNGIAICSGAVDVLHFDCVRLNFKHELDDILLKGLSSIGRWNHHLKHPGIKKSPCMVMHVT